MERYIFFNSAPGDARTYQAADFADYFGSVLSTGLLHTDNVPGMVVSVEGGTLNTIVSAGKAIMKGHLYENTAALTLAHSIPEAILDRIDRVVLRLDLRNAERNIKLHVKEGVASATPAAPVLQRDNFIYEISLAQIRVRKNTVQLLATDLIDERLDETLCGLVYSLISIPTDQLQAYITARMAEADIEADQFEQQLTQNLADYEQEYRTWFDSLQASGFATPQSVQAVDDKLTAHKAEDATDAHNASNISVADANNRFTGTNVETVLNELFQFANSGKTDIASVIGSPATSGDSFSQLKTHIQDRKNELATNLSAKGQTSAGTETLDALVDKVALVNTGKKFATGSTIANSSVRTCTTTGGFALSVYPVAVSGLDFRPSTVIVWRTSNGDARSYYQDPVSYEGFIASYAPVLNYFFSVSKTTTPTSGNANVYNGGFIMPVSNTNSTAALSWIAIE